jgi:hypothetical protein
MPASSADKKEQGLNQVSTMEAAEHKLKLNIVLEMLPFHVWEPFKYNLNKLKPIPKN